MHPTSGSEKVYDARQLQAINASDGHFLVLAPPGCGKTGILAERIARALLRGVDAKDVLCLTFTNRASRGMRDRVAERLAPEISSGRIAPGAVNDITMGNMHRYCSHYLFDNALVPENSYIIDEDDQADIFVDIDRSLFFSHGEVSRYAVKYCVDLASYITQAQLGHPQELRPQSPGRLDSYNATFIAADFEHYYRIAEKYNFDLNAVPTENNALRASLRYLEYKKTSGILDFADLLIHAYDHMRSNADIRRFRWIQVDEVQDLNALQFAIVDLLTARENPTVMYLGDEQQAIFSFMGAKLSCLEKLKDKCRGSILSLQSNYRAPSYLLDVCNDFAAGVLGVSPDLLPMAEKQVQKQPRDLIIAQSPTFKDQMDRVGKMVKYYLGLSDDERLAILVNRNAEADDISEKLTKIGVGNFKISGIDMFRSPGYKTLSAFLSVLVNEFNTGAWARLIFGTNALPSMVKAREFCQRLRDLMLTPSDLITPTSYLQRFADECLQGEFVLFDTETTGLNTAEDDIVQIAAFKVRDGQKVEGTDFNILLHTDREIPAMLGEKRNPLVAEYADREHMSRAEGLAMFLAYVGTLPVAGHNVEYDYRILQANCRRELCEEVELDCYDTLRIAKLVFPWLKKYTLESLIDQLGLQGKNSHLADADIGATLSLIQRCAAEIMPKLPEQGKFLADAHTNAVARRLQDVAPLLDNIRQYMHAPTYVTDRTISDELADLHRTLCDRGIIKNLGAKFDVFVHFAENEWVDREAETSLHDQLAAHIYDITSTINEGDLVSSICDYDSVNGDPDDEHQGSGSPLISERVFILTVHKAKGLEFDNVVVLSVENGVYPFYKANQILANVGSSPEEIAAAEAVKREDARKLYVAISRARKRLCLSYADRNPWGYPTGASPFLYSIARHFIR